MVSNSLAPKAELAAARMDDRQCMRVVAQCDMSRAALPQCRPA